MYGHLSAVTGIECLQVMGTYSLRTPLEDSMASTTISHEVGREIVQLQGENLSLEPPGTGHETNNIVAKRVGQNPPEWG